MTALDPSIVGRAAGDRIPRLAEHLDAQHLALLVHHRGIAG